MANVTLTRPTTTDKMRDKARKEIKDEAPKEIGPEIKAADHLKKQEAPGTK